MENNANIKFIAKHTTLEERKVCIQHARATVRGRYASGGIDLVGAADGLLRVGFGCCIDEAHGSGFSKETGRRIIRSHHNARCTPQRLSFNNITLGSKLFKSPCVGHKHVARNMLNDNRVRNDIKVLTRGMLHLRDQRIIITITYDQGIVITNKLGLLLESCNIVGYAGHFAERIAIQIYLIEIAVSLLGEMPVPVDEAGQHGFAAQIDNFVDLGLIKIALCLGVGFGTHKNDLAVQCGNDFGFLGVIDVLGLLHRFRNGIDFTIVVYGIGNFVRSIQLHTAAENHRHGRRERQSLLLYTVFHECSSCKKLTLPGAFLLVPFPDSDSRKAYFPDFG